MILPISWLNDYVDVPADTDEVLRRLTAIGHMQDGPAETVATSEGETLVYDLEVRQNRSDCLSLLGVARETAAAFDLKVKWPEAYSQELPELSGGTQVTVKDDTLCHRFQTLTFTGVRVGPSPAWLTAKLESYGIKSINVVVDITNYVMVELGQPLHAFDADKVQEHHLVIRSAQNGETLTVLGEKSIQLTADDLIIADPQKPIALAGVMGGLATSVSDSTTSIIVEAANYDQASVRRSALRHTLRTEASTRLEKFLHPQLTDLALRRVKQLLEDLAGAKLVDHTDAYPEQWSQTKITLRQNQLNRLAGFELSLKEAQKLLSQEEVMAEMADDETLKVTIPYFRTDLEQEADLIEEVLRLHGYTHIPSLGITAPAPANLQSPTHEFEEQLRDALTATGYDEQISEPLTVETQPEREPVKLENSLTSEKSMLRTTLRHDLERGVQERRKYRQENVLLFEVGRVYWQENSDFHEEPVVGVIASGPKVNFSQFKGDLEAVLARLGYRWSDADIELKQLNDTPTYYAQWSVAALLDRTPTPARVLTSPPQVVLQDLSLIAPTEVPVGSILETIRAASPLVYQTVLGEEPQAMESGTQSIFVKISFHDDSRTLSTQDVEPVRKEILNQLHTLQVQPR